MEACGGGVKGDDLGDPQTGSRGRRHISVKSPFCGFPLAKRLSRARGIR